MDIIYQYARSLTVGAIPLASWLLIYGWKMCHSSLPFRKNKWLDAAISSLNFPLQFVILCSGFLGVAFYFLGDQEILRILGYTLIATGIVWTLINFAKKGEKVILQSQNRQIDQMNLDLAVRMLHIGIVAGGLVFVLPLMHVSIAGLLAFGGMGAIVVGIAARDMLANMFGGFILILDRPFRVGDWIEAPEKQIQGYVEHVGWRATRICAIDKQTISVPNSVFATVALQNRPRITRRMIETTVTLRYQDTIALEAIIKEMRQHLQSSHLIDKRQDCFVYVDNLSLIGYRIFIRCYTFEVSPAKFFEIQEDIYLNTTRIVHKHGASFATAQTLLSTSADC